MEYSPLFISQCKVNIDYIKISNDKITDMVIYDIDIDLIIKNFELVYKDLLTIKNRDNITLISTLLKKSYNNGLPLLKTIVEKQNYISMLSCVLHKINIMDNVKKIKYIEILVDGFKDCQQMQYRITYNLYVELTNFFSIEARIKLLIECLKKKWLHETIYECLKIKNGIIDIHIENSYINIINSEIPMIDHIMVKYDKLTHSVENNNCIDIYISKINAEDIIKIICDNLINDTNNELNSEICRWLKIYDMYNSSSYDENGLITIDTIIKMLIKLNIIIEPEYKHNIKKKIKSIDYEINDDEDYIYDNEDNGDEYYEDEYYEYEYTEEDILNETNLKLANEEKNKLFFIERIFIENIVLFPYFLTQLSKDKKTITTKLIITIKNNVAINIEYIINGSKLLKHFFEHMILLQINKKYLYDWTNIILIEDIEIFYNLILNEIKIAHTKCIICNKLHDGYVDTIISCKNEFCIEQFTENKMGKDVMIEIKNNPQVVELLILFTYWACNNKHTRDIIFNLFPKKFIKDGLKNYDLIIESLDRMITIPLLKDMIDTNCFQSYFEDDVYMNETMYLLHWIINSNRTQLKFIDNDIQTEDEKLILKDIKNGYLFQIINNPEKEKNFKINSIINKVERVYHGSSSYSWQSIIRNSLQNLSGTSLQANGQAYGKGVYLTTSLITVNQYSKKCDSNFKNKSLNIEKCYLILDKIINNASIKPLAPSDFRIEENTDNIIMRYLVCF